MKLYIQMCLIVMYNYKSTKIYFPVNYIDVCSCCFSFNQTASAYLKTTSTKHKKEVWYVKNYWWNLTYSLVTFMICLLTILHLSTPNDILTSFHYTYRYSYIFSLHLSMFLHIFTTPIDILTSFHWIHRFYFYLLNCIKHCLDHDAL